MQATSCSLRTAIQIVASVGYAFNPEKTLGMRLIGDSWAEFIWK